MAEFKLPDVGEGLTEAEIVSWKVKVGDVIEINDIIVEIETAKSLVELPSPYAGTILALMVDEGEMVQSVRRSSRSETRPRPLLLRLLPRRPPRPTCPRWTSPTPPRPVAARVSRWSVVTRPSADRSAGPVVAPRRRPPLPVRRR
ncbi:biotin/lipoyl-containing protein [Nocardioides sp. B-3]|uniref:biotin/lipoyl-containing protein n=1 Tax=Nocardioides sp. B-3 TaxID=2895565 RepID=UPI003FA576AE